MMVGCTLKKTYRSILIFVNDALGHHHGGLTCKLFILGIAEPRILLIHLFLHHLGIECLFVLVLLHLGL